jgi:hypothetical protein
MKASPHSTGPLLVSEESKRPVPYLRYFSRSLYIRQVYLSSPWAILLAPSLRHLYSHPNVLRILLRGFSEKNIRPLPLPYLSTFF